MFEKIFEAVYDSYDPLTKLEKLTEYMSKVPNNTKTFVKLAAFRAAEADIYNISDIVVSKELVDGTANYTDNPKIVRIIYSRSSDEVCTCKKFHDMCKKILEALKDVDPKLTVLETSTRPEKKGGRFRFYYDNTTNCALFIKAANTGTVENFLKAHADEFAKTTKTKKTVVIKNDEGIVYGPPPAPEALEIGKV